MRGKSGVAVIPGDVIQVAVAAARGSRSGGVFPFRFARKSSSDRAAILVGLDPRDVFHGQIRSLEDAGIVAHDLFKGGLRDFGPAQPESFGQGRLAGGRFVREAILVIRRTSAREGSGRNPQIGEPVLGIRFRVAELLSNSQWRDGRDEASQYDGLPLHFLILARRRESTNPPGWWRCPRPRFSRPAPD